MSEENTSSAELLKQVSAPRPKRYVSHALVEVRRHRWLPFFAESAVLLDLSTQGFKIEFTGEVHVQPHHLLWISIPLSPLGILSPARLTVPVEVKWFDNKRFRLGGVFRGLSNDDRVIIEKVLASIRSQRLE